MKQSLSSATPNQRRDRTDGSCCVIGLAEVCQREGIVFDSSLQRMLETDFCKRNSLGRNWLNLSTFDISSFLILEYHHPLKMLLIWTNQVIQGCENSHKEQNIQWSQLSALFKLFKSELELHLAKEEIMLFPSLHAIERGQQTIFGDLNDLQQATLSMQDESLKASMLLKEITCTCKNICFQNERCSAFSLLLFLLNRIAKLLRMSCYIRDAAILPRILSA
ncbi:MAG: hypothetical protein K2X77_19115 [Candidatus Obscuribacterales bacterium]|jgi:iron-sulfur cluster repair protein YtfE (RIC family)|nr:hypothetical protein [Candidatus Obscuribacterales bacterium]